MRRDFHARTSNNTGSPDFSTFRFGSWIPDNVYVYESLGIAGHAEPRSVLAKRCPVRVDSHSTGRIWFEQVRMGHSNIYRRLGPGDVSGASGRRRNRDDSVIQYSGRSRDGSVLARGGAGYNTSASSV